MPTAPSGAPGPWVERWLSRPRFNTYLASAESDRTVALALYEWNTAMSAAILHDLAHVEVAIRNAYNDALVAHQRGSLHWTEDAEQYFPVKIGTARDGTRIDLNAQPRAQVARAIKDAGGPSAPRGKVVAELMFGFWRYMTTGVHEVGLWRPYLHHAFPAGTLRNDVDRPMKNLSSLRNRVAHHEPLLRANLLARHNDVLAVLSLISPDLRDHVQAYSTWLSTQGQRPA